MQRRSTSLILGAALLATVPTLAAAGTIDLRRDEVIPVIVRNELNFKTTESGDKFRADVTDNRMLPYGTKVEGRVNRVQKKRGSDQGYMDIEFTSLILPDGTRTRISATPISLNSNYVSRGKDGRWEAKKGYKKETVVLGTTAGGLILGSLIKKPFEGAILGALAGILVAETDKDHVGDGNIVIPKDTKVGALLDQDVRVSWNGSWDDEDYGTYGRDGYNTAGYDRYGYDRNGKYNARYDQGKDRDSHSRSNDDRGYDRNGYDRDGYDRDGRYNSRYDQGRNSANTDRYQQRTDDRDIQIEVDRTSLRFRGNEVPYYRGGMVMVPLRSMADQLDMNLGDERGGGFSLESGRDTFRMEDDSRAYWLNGRKGTLAGEIEVKDGVTYVPIQVFSLLKKNLVYVNGTKY